MYNHVTITEKDIHKTAFCNTDGSLHECIRTGFGLAVIPATFTRIVKRALGNLHPDVVSWIDDTLISSHTWKEHITTLADICTKLSNARRLVNNGKCRFAASSQEFREVIVDATGMKSAPSSLEAIGNMPESTTVEELRSFLGLTGCLGTSCRGIP